MDIVVGATIPLKSDKSESGPTLPQGKKDVFKERRKNRWDRRKSVREGIYVSLSMTNDRRVRRDRRKISS